MRGVPPDVPNPYRAIVTSLIYIIVLVDDAREQRRSKANTTSPPIHPESLGRPARQLRSTDISKCHKVSLVINHYMLLSILAKFDFSRCIPAQEAVISNALSTTRHCPYRETLTKPRCGIDSQGLIPKRSGANWSADSQYMKHSHIVGDLRRFTKRSKSTDALFR